MKSLIKILLIMQLFAGLACSSGGEKADEDEYKWGYSIKKVEQPFSGKIITLLCQAVELHKKEVGISLEKYEVNMLQDDEYYYIYFVDPNREPGAIGIGEIPSYQVRADKKTLKILSHTATR